MAFKLSLKRTLNKWVEIEGVKFKLKYPTISQGKEIERLEAEAFKYEFVPNNDGNVEIKLKDIDFTKHLELKRYCIKVWIEDWEGMTENNEHVKCELENNELKEDLWWGLVKDVNVVNILYERFKKEMEFNSTDKKK